MNGDGLLDLVELAKSSQRYYPNMGLAGFGDEVEITPSLNIRFPERVRTEDMNGDGLSDIIEISGCDLNVFFNQGLSVDNYREHHIQAAIKFEAPSGTWSSQSTSRLADINANGSTDVLCHSLRSSDRMAFWDLSPHEQPYQLKTIRNGLGKTTTLEYTSLAEEMVRDREAGEPWTTTVPVAFQVVKKITVEDSLSGQIETSTMDYHNGYYDGEEQQFRGFAQAEQTQLGDEHTPTLVTAYEFHTGIEHEALKGRPKKVAAREAGGAVFWQESQTWETRALLDGADGEHSVTFAAQLERERRVLEKGQGTPVTLKWEFDYDDYGNPIYTYEHGRVEGNWDDERITHQTFSSAFPSGQANWILNRLVERRIEDENGTVFARQQNFYDDETFSAANLGEVTQGNLTLTRDWVAPALGLSDTLDSARQRYDEWGNVIAIYDPLWGKAPGHERRITYDETYQTFPEVEEIDTGSLTLTASAEYDKGFGVLTAFTDFNGHTTTYAYDELARVTSVVKPGDSAAAPTTTYLYQLGFDLGNDRRISWVHTEQREKSGEGTLQSRTYYDGFARPVMTRSESTEGRVVVSDRARYDARGNPHQAYLPYYASSFNYTNAVPPNAGVRDTEYDALGRVLRTHEPAIEGQCAVNEVQYKPLAELHYDAAQRDFGSKHFGNYKQLTFDGLLNDKGQGRLRSVGEQVKVSDCCEPHYHHKISQIIDHTIMRFYGGFVTLAS